jgi:NAD(P)H dehydrogenase (quinone)
MSTVSIVHYSNSGTTALLADAVARGARSVDGTDVQVFALSGDQIVQGRWQDEAVLQALSDSDAIIFGTPTYMGGVAAQFKAFADATGGIWYNRGWRDKVAGGFTVSGSPSGDKLSTLSYLSLFAAQHGMTWVGSNLLPASGEEGHLNRIGSHLGAMAQNPSRTGGPASLHPGDAATAEAYGKRIAEFAQRLQPVAA